MENEKLFDLEKIKAAITDWNQVKEALKTIGSYILIYAIFLFIMNFFEISPDSVRDFFEDQGLFLIPTFIVVQLLASLTPLPDTPFLAVGILFFEPWLTFLLIWTGMWLGTLINFLLARRLGREWVKSNYPQASNWIDKFAGKYGFETIIISRSFTMVTFDLVAYAAGISSIRFGKFALASVIGLIPVALNGTLVGLALTSRQVGNAFVYFLISAALATIFGIVAKQLNNYIEHKRNLKQNQE